MGVQPAKQPQGSVASIDSWVWLALALILCTGVVIRILASPDWFNYDESQHYLVAKSPLFSDFIREFRKRTHPPLNYLLMKPFVVAAPTFLSARLVPIAAGSLSILVSFLVFRRASRSNWTALAGSVLVALASIFVVQDTSVRGYGLMLFFIWLSFLQFLRMEDGRLSSHRDLYLMAWIVWLALASEYSAAIHVVALGAVVWIPFMAEDFKLRRWRRPLVSMAPYIVPLILTAVLFVWQFKTGYPVEYGHTRHGLYQGSFTDISEVIAFLWTRVTKLTSGIAPEPWGGIALALALAPVLSGRLWVDRERRLAVYCAVIISLMMVASLLGAYPMGSSVRHSVFVVPGILAAALLSVGGILRACVKPPLLRIMVGGSLLLVIAISLGNQSARLLNQTERVILKSSESTLLAKYQNEPGPLVTNWRGRTCSAIWFFRSAASRKVGKVENALIFDLDGTTVVQSTLTGAKIRLGLQPPLIADWATQLAREQGRSWIVLSGKTTDELDAVRIDILKLLAAQPDIQIRFQEVGRYARIGSGLRSRDKGGRPFDLTFLVMMIESES